MKAWLVSKMNDFIIIAIIAGVVMLLIIGGFCC
jgi:hypothetical protein